MSYHDDEVITIEEVEATVARCEDCWYDGPCYHCRQKQFLLNVICAGLVFEGFFVADGYDVRAYYTGSLGFNAPNWPTIAGK